MLVPRGDEIGEFTEVDAAATGDVYTVVRGDTLWDICQVFFGNPEAWPGLWSINNDEITNPHYIFPGQLLRLQAGSDLRPPSLIAGRGLQQRINAVSGERGRGRRAEGAPHSASQQERAGTPERFH